MATTRPSDGRDPFVTVTARGATLADMRAQATAHISAILGTHLVAVCCDSVEQVEQVESTPEGVSRVALWEAKFRGFDTTL